MDRPTTFHFVICGSRSKLHSSSERKMTHERDEKTTSPRRESDSRPKVYETFALPAELLGQNKAISAARYLMLRAKINITEISFLV
jgi:hypothetical protein